MHKCIYYCILAFMHSFIHKNMHISISLFVVCAMYVRIYVGSLRAVSLSLLHFLLRRIIVPPALSLSRVGCCANETHVHTYRQTARHADTQTHRPRHMGTQINRYRQTHRHANKQIQTDTQTHRCTDRHNTLSNFQTWCLYTCVHCAHTYTQRHTWAKERRVYAHI